jgi:hypothetical protein
MENLENTHEQNRGDHELTPGDIHNNMRSDEIKHIVVEHAEEESEDDKEELDEAA